MGYIGEIWAGRPAKLLRKLEEAEAAFICRSADNYAVLAGDHAIENAKSFPEVELDKARRRDRELRDPDYDSHMGLQVSEISQLKYMYWLSASVGTVLLQGETSGRSWCRGGCGQETWPMSQLPNWPIWRGYFGMFMLAPCALKCLAATLRCIATPLQTM